MNNTLKVFNQVLTGFNQKPINILIVGAGDKERIGYLIEYIVKFGGKLTICDTKVDNLKITKSLFSNFLDKHEIVFYLGEPSNFYTPEWNLIYLSEGFSAKGISFDSSVVLTRNGNIDFPPSLTFSDSDLVLYVPGQKKEENNEFVNEVNKTNQIRYAEVNGEKFLIVCLYGSNRQSETLEYHKKVFTHWKIPCNYVGLNFNGLSHGTAADFVINQTKHLEFDYWFFIDVDAIPLRADFLNIIHDKVKDKETLAGPLQQSNHLFNKDKNEKSFNHPYVGLFSLVLSKELWNKLGNPSLNANDNSDNAEELTYLCEEKGFNVFQIWPKSCLGMTDEEAISVETPLEHKKSKLGSSSEFGLATIYGQNLLFHGFCQNVERSRKLFIEKCKEVLGNQ